MRQLRFKFMLPKIYGGIFYHQEKTIYIYAINLSKEDEAVFIDEIEQLITHETLHAVILKVAGSRTANKMDKIYKKVWHWDAEVYNLLY